MARIAQGRGIHAIPVLTGGLTDQVWVKSGEASKVDGCYFQVVGGVEKVKGVRNMVDWDSKELHLLNTRINAITTYRSRNGPEELIVSLSGDTSKAIGVFTNATTDAIEDGNGNVREKFIGGRILVLRNNRLEHPLLPHIAEGGAWDRVYSTDKTGSQYIAIGRVEPEDQYGGDFFATWAGWLFAVNGTDENIKWNGSYASVVGVHERPTPPRAKSKVSTRYHRDYSIGDEFSGAGDGDRGNLGNVEQRFQYRATFVSASGAEGPPSEAGEFAVTGRKYLDAVYDEIKQEWFTAKRRNDKLGNPTLHKPHANADLLGNELSQNPHRAIIEINGLDRPTQPDVIWRNIYKRARDGQYYFWRQVAANEEVVWDYESTLPSADMGSPLKEALTPPPTSKFVAFFRGRGYYIPTEFPSFVFYSDPGLPEQMSSALQYLDVNSVDGSVITGLYAFGDSLVVFKENSIWQVTALADGSPVLTPIDESVGGLAPRAVVLAYERLLFLGASGVYQFDGATIKPLSESLNTWWKNVYVEGLRTATAWLDESERRLFISLQSGPDDVNDMVICYHYQLDAITLVKGQKITASAHYKGEAVLGVQHDVGAKLGRAGRRFKQVSVRGSDLVLWGLGNSFSYEFRPGGGKATDNNSKTVSVSAGSVAGKIRFGPYSANQTGWDADETMEVMGIDLFAPYVGSHQLTIRWFKDRSPVPAGSRTISLNQDGYAGQKDRNTDLTSKAGWGETDRVWGTSSWNGDEQLFQRVVFPEAVICREIEVEFENGNEGEPFVLDGFVLWRTSKGSESQR